MLRRLAKIPKYLGKFGFFRGLVVFFSIERVLPIKSNKLDYVQLPGHRSPLALRASRADHSIFWQVLVSEHYEYRQFRQGKNLDKLYGYWISTGKTPLIIDCGGNIGLSAVWFARRFPMAKIVTIEPDAENFDVLQHNIRHYENVVALHGAVWNEKAWFRIQNPTSGAAAFRVEVAPADDAEAIEGYTINEIVAGEATCPLLLVKLDIEGAQKQLFSSNSEWVENCEVIVIELDDWLLPWQATSQSLFACTSRLNFDYLINGENLLCFRHGEAVDIDESAMHASKQ